ncbi:Oidioi.mRNA.OKI2018_I69.XSR.g16667.t1.cds [Oikopleura dioica]|uniref:Oidioi.mRNA.OKI2018_I69.XSR.g16667.t1.cds n=1 Tax=Oikopleura dioica TaxID=34765 RepID=A0ABN7SGV6_OIKDI|nr:Oidioi.mRNA.OKI2018_I69.XSR.g16667.t1.cds [Oikopleura dioica]
MITKRRSKNKSRSKNKRSQIKLMQSKPRHHSPPRKTRRAHSRAPVTINQYIQRGGRTLSSEDIGSSKNKTQTEVNLEAAKSVNQSICGEIITPAAQYLDELQFYEDSRSRHREYNETQFLLGMNSRMRGTSAARTPPQQYSPQQFRPQEFHHQAYQPRQYHPGHHHPQQFYPQQYHPQAYYPQGYQPHPYPQQSAYDPFVDGNGLNRQSSSQNFDMSEHCQRRNLESMTSNLSPIRSSWNREYRNRSNETFTRAPDESAMSFLQALSINHDDSIEVKKMKIAGGKLIKHIKSQGSDNEWKLKAEMENEEFQTLGSPETQPFDGSPVVPTRRKILKKKSSSKRRERSHADIFKKAQSFEINEESAPAQTSNQYLMNPVDTAASKPSDTLASFDHSNPLNFSLEEHSAPVNLLGDELVDSKGPEERRNDRRRSDEFLVPKSTQNSRKSQQVSVITSQTLFPENSAPSIKTSSQKPAKKRSGQLKPVYLKRKSSGHSMKKKIASESPKKESGAKVEKNRELQFEKFPSIEEILNGATLDQSIISSAIESTDSEEKNIQDIAANSTQQPDSSLLFPIDDDDKPRKQYIGAFNPLADESFNTTINRTQDEARLSRENDKPWSAQRKPGDTIIKPKRLRRGGSSRMSGRDSGSRAVSPVKFVGAERISKKKTSTSTLKNESRTKEATSQLRFHRDSSDEDDVIILKADEYFSQLSKESVAASSQSPSSALPSPIPVFPSTSNSEDIPSTSTSNDESQSKRRGSRRARKTTRPPYFSKIPFAITQGSEIPLPKPMKTANNKKKSASNLRDTRSETTSTSTEPAAPSNQPENTPRVVRTNVIRNYDSTASHASSSNGKKKRRIGIIKLHGRNWNGKEWKSEVLQAEGTWVECVECKKWRYLKECTDPALLPDYWICEMNPDPRKKYNHCSKPEEKPDHPGGSKYWIYSDIRLTVGSIVWIGIHAPGLPWPAMGFWSEKIEIDQERGEFMRNNGDHDSVHVTMMPCELGKFQRPINKWVPTYDMTPFVDYGPDYVRHYLLQESKTVRDRWRAAFLFAKHANMEENAALRSEKYGLEFQIMKWSQDEAQPGKSAKYTSNEAAIANIEKSLKIGKKKKNKKSKK